MRISRGHGFTLIEVMVSLLIVAVTLSAGIKAAGTLTESAARLQTVTLAQWCADNYLVEMRLKKAFPSVGDTDFTCEQLGRTFHGQLLVRPTPNINFRRVEVRIKDEDDWQAASIATIIAPPQWTD